MWTLIAARLRVVLARRDLHAQLQFIARMNRELNEARAALPGLARTLAGRQADVKRAALDRRAPVGHITGQKLIP